jgi:hypothetical protein
MIVELDASQRGFDEFFGYLYHLDAMEDPAHPNYPPDLKDKIGPRNAVARADPGRQIENGLMSGLDGFRPSSPPPGTPTSSRS